MSLGSFIASRPVAALFQRAGTTDLLQLPSSGCGAVWFHSTSTCCRSAAVKSRSKPLSYRSSYSVWITSLSYVQPGTVENPSAREHSR